MERPDGLPLRPGGLAVAVEATRLLHDLRGIGRYVRAVLPRLVSLRPDLRLTLFAKNRNDVDELTAAVESDPARWGYPRVLHVRQMAGSRSDVFWYPWNVASPVPSHGAVVVTMHDVAPLVLPDPRWSRSLRNFRSRHRYATTARRAAIIIADSSFTADEAERVLGIPRERIRIALLAADDFPVPPACEDAATLARCGVSRPFVLAVGAPDRRKNLAFLQRAMHRVVAANPHVTLVLAGPRRRLEAPLPATPWMRTLGFVSDHDLAVLYRTAAALVMPSVYEGFGLPVLEAMRLGGPVICLRASSLPEVAGDAAVWFDRCDEADLAAAIVRVLSDDGMRARMRIAGLQHAARFSWDETARGTLGAFDDALRLSPEQRSWESLPGVEARSWCDHQPREPQCDSA